MSAEMTAHDLRALAQLVNDREAVVVRHENLLAVLRPGGFSPPSPPPRPPSTSKHRY